MVQAVCLGELLIDFVSLESGVSLIDAPSFQKAPGGAPANVAVGLSHLGHEVGFVGKVGKESFGEFLTGVLRDNQVDVSGISHDPDTRTMLAFVSLTAEGERDFMFYRHPSADMKLTPDEIPEEMLTNATLFHYGSISLISDPCRSATLHALDVAKNAGLLISYDPNLRLGLWDSEEQARQEMLNAMPYADVVKINEDELEFLTGTSDFENGTKSLLESGPSLIVITLGGKGCYVYSESVKTHVPAYPVKIVDTTGAGDGFVAGLLSGLLQSQTPHQPFVVPEQEQLEAYCRLANAVGGITATKRGAIPSLPSRAEVEEFMNRQG